MLQENSIAKQSLYFSYQLKNERKHSFQLAIKEIINQYTHVHRLSQNIISPIADEQIIRNNLVKIKHDETSSKNAIRSKNCNKKLKFYSIFRLMKNKTKLDT